MIQIPQKGKAKEEIFKTLESYKGDDLDNLSINYDEATFFQTG